MHTCINKTRFSEDANIIELWNKLTDVGPLSSQTDFRLLRSPPLDVLLMYTLNMCQPSSMSYTTKYCDVMGALIFSESISN